METVEAEAHPAGDPGAGTRPSRFGPWRREVGAYLELFALCGVAIAQPTLDIFQQNADYLLSRRTTVQEAVLFAVLLIVVPASVLWVVEVLVGLLLPAARRWVHAAFGALLVGILAVELLKRITGAGPTVLVAAGVVLGVAGGLLMLRVAPIRTFLRYLAVAPPVFAVIFVFASQVTPVIFVSDPPAADVRAEKPGRVVMIVMDELPTASLLDGEGNIDAALFPNFAALAGSGNWYRNHSTVAPHTTTAVPAILTGSHPTNSDVPIASEYPHNLFTLLAGSYDMNVHESATRMCPVDICGSGDSLGVNDGLDGLVGEGVSQWQKFASPNRTSRQDSLLRQSPYVENAIDSSRAFIRSLEPSTRPQLDFLHVLLPHTPWHYLGAAQDYVTLADQGVRVGTWRDSWNAAFGRSRHLLQLQTADWIVGRVVDRLRRIGAYDDSMIVVTADHGVAFTPGVASRGASNLNYSEVMWTPLVVKLPGQTTGVVDDRRAETIDIVPTIADEIQARLPWEVDGRSLLGEPLPDGPRRLADWALNQVRPESGKSYVEFDGPAGFAKVLTLAASRAPGDPALRLHRIGGYGGLVGLPAGPLVVPGAPAPAALLENAADYRDVDLDARRIPWAYAQGSIAQPAGRWVAVVVNGTIAAVSQTMRGDGGRSDFAAVLPPSLVREGRNEVEVFVVRGPLNVPQLQPTRLAR